MDRPEPSTATAPTAVRVEVGAFGDRTLAAVVSMVSRHPPFISYSFGLMVHNLTQQLKQGCNVMLIHEGRLVAYAGWLSVARAEAARWYEGACEIPDDIGERGDAAIVTIVVGDSTHLLAPLVRGISHVCAGLPVYRMRSFQDGRADMRRPPIVGRRHVWR